MDYRFFTIFIIVFSTFVMRRSMLNHLLFSANQPDQLETCTFVVSMAHAIPDYTIHNENSSGDVQYIQSAKQYSYIELYRMAKKLIR